MSRARFILGIAFDLLVACTALACCWLASAFVEPSWLLTRFEVFITLGQLVSFSFISAQSWLDWQRRNRSPNA